MQEAINLFNTYSFYFVPPLVGAFIGYLTNKIAIKMLFRPLKPWRILGIRVPMTPGVIPSKRHELSKNMGQMVGDHLLTSVEISKALKKDTFQNHLYLLTETRVGGILEKDLGPLPTVIPSRFTTYFDVALSTIKYQINDQISAYIQTDGFEKTVKGEINNALEELLSQEFNTVIHPDEQQQLFVFLENKLENFLSSSAVEQFISSWVRKKIYGFLQQGRSISDFKLDGAETLVQSIIKEQTPKLLEGLGRMLNEPLVQDRIVEGAQQVVQKFIAGLGPMGAMAGNILTDDLIEQKVKEYLEEKEEDIIRGVTSSVVSERFERLIFDRLKQFSSTPLVKLLPENSEEAVEQLCVTLEEIAVSVVQDKNNVTMIADRVNDGLIDYMSTNPSLKNVIETVLGENNLDSIREWLVNELVKIFRSKTTLKTIEGMVTGLIDKLMEKPIGKLSGLLPAGVRDGMYKSLTKLASDMLAHEVPGLVDSLKIQTIVTEKIDSLDLLKLEKLLLSIMEEQFKYINLFGALLGFIIGCFNLLLFLTP